MSKVSQRVRRHRRSSSAIDMVINGVDRFFYDFLVQRVGWIRSAHSVCAAHAAVYFVEPK